MRVGIVGAGVTGLALTHYLSERGVEPVTVERREEPGGVVRSRRVEGRVLELGPQRTRLTPTIRDLVEDLGLADELLTAPGDLPLYVYRDGALRLVPTSPREALTTDLLSWRGKARVLLEPFTGDAREGETVGEFLTRKFGREVTEWYFGLLYASIYGSDPDEMLMEYSLGRALETFDLDSGSILLAVARRSLGGRETPPVCSFEDGLGALADALHAENGEHVRLGSPATAIVEADGGYELHAGGEATRVDEVVLTTPADVTADLLEPLDPESAAALRELTYNPLALVHLRADVDREGLGYQVAPGESLRTLGVTWNAGMFDRDGVYTCYFGGQDREVLEWADDRLGARAAAEFETVMGAPAEVLSVHRWPRGMPAFDRTWTATERVAPPEGIRLATNYMGRAGLPGRFREAKRLAAALADAEGTEAVPASA